jgi:signal transduction histidine kinase
MNHHRLHWRIGLPFALFVIAGSMALVVLMLRNTIHDERAKFEQLARANADFIDKVNLPPSPRMADELRQVLGVWVMFRKDRVLTPEPLWLVSMVRVADLPANGTCHVLGTLEAVIVPLDSGHELVLVRPKFVYLGRSWMLSILPVLGAFWCLALLVAWLISRSLVRPLQHLAAKLPDIEKPEPIDLPEAKRRDEIGDVARAFVRTREALQGERLERERAEKLAVLGRMTAALAHEIQNPVAAIKMHAQLWDADTGKETAAIIEHEAARIEGLVNQWMFLSKPQPPAMSGLDVSALLAQVVKSHQPQLDHAQVGATLHAGEPLLVRGDAKRLTQVFSNLLVNAIQAMPRGGQLSITCIRDGPRVQITFADTGAGFSSEALSRFSEFFFSEKEGGMGIGLSVASEIVKAHGGDLRVANRPEGGACVTVSLPAAGNAPTASVPPH